MLYNVNGFCAQNDELNLKKSRRDFDGYNLSMAEITLGQKVLISRRDLDLTQAELADLAGISRSHVANIENERVTNIGADVVRNLAAALRVSQGYLLGITDDPLEGIDVLAEGTERYSAASPEEEELLELINEMTPAQRRQMLWGARLILGGDGKIIE